MFLYNIVSGQLALLLFIFDKIQHNKHHLFHYLLPAPSAASQCYNLRRRPHTQLLPQHRGHLMDSNFITRTLYKNIY